LARVVGKKCTDHLCRHLVQSSFEMGPVLCIPSLLKQISGSLPGQVGRVLRARGDIADAAAKTVKGQSDEGTSKSDQRTKGKVTKKLVNQ